MSSLTLNVHVPWTEVLDAVDVPVQNRGLPARVRCPLCSGARLMIYDDTICGGAWHYCFDCQHAGDMIELMAAFWNVSPGAAVRRLTNAGFPIPEDKSSAKDINTYVAGHSQYRNRMTNLWKKSRDYLVKTASPVLNNLRDKFRITNQMSDQRWLDGPGNLVGAYPHVAIESVFIPTAVIGNRCVSSSRSFIGRNWSDVLVIPHYDLPARICGFLCVGRNGLPTDRVFRSPMFQHDSCHRHNDLPKFYEGGLACHWAIQNSHGMLQDHIVACEDPFLALRLHVRHFSSARTALPLVAWHDSKKVRTYNAWRSLGHKIPVHWGWRMTPGLVYQAIRSGGKIALTELSDTSQFRIDHFIRNAEPRTILARVVKAAKPWREYLSDWSERVLDGTVEDLLLGLETYGIDPNTLRDIGPRFETLARIGNRPREIKVNKQALLEQDGQWWHVDSKTYRQGHNKTNEPALVMNATLRIDRTRVIRRDGRDVLRYKGYITHQGDKIAFEVDAPKSPFGFRQTLETVLAKAKPGTKLFVSPQWQGRLVEAAKLFSGL